LLFLSLACGILSCNAYRHLEKTSRPGECLQKFRPDIRRALYRTAVDITGRHISGLLLIKALPDSSTRIVFSNEAGFSFFDFGFLPGNGFRVYHIIPQMDKKAVIQTLRKDFDLVLFRNMDESRRFTLEDSARLYFGCPQEKGVNYYITDKGCTRLLKMQRASSRKPVVEALLFPGPDGIPDSLSIRHLNFHFSISLKKI
jgi:hypothetical protein